MNIIGTNIKNNIKRTIIVMALPIILLFFVGPLSVYCSNSGDFSFYYDDFFFSIGALGLALMLLGVLLLSVLPEKINKVICMLVFYAGIMFYIQDMFMNVKLAEIDGSSMNWDNMKSYTAINGAIWIAILILIIVLFIKFREKILKIAIYMAAFLTVIQIVAFVTLFIDAVKVEATNKESTIYGLVGDNQYKLAADNNVIVIILDSYGTAQLDDGLNNNPELLDGLNDFTYYNNADSCYTGTFPSMTHMLTGVDLNMDISSPEYLERAWTDNSAREFYTTVHNAGYEINLYSTGGTQVYGYVKNLYGLFDNACPVELIVDRKSIFFRMTKISIYKFVPYVLKPIFEVPTYMFYYVTEYAENRGIDCSNTAFHDNIKNGLDIDNELSKQLIVQHLDGTHPPFGIDAYGEGKDDASMQEVQEGLIYILTEYFNELKRLGLYDSSTIIITADHGRWSVFEENDDPFVVYFVKKANESHDQMIINTAPISHDDFRATILSLIGEDYSSYGSSIFDIKEDDMRERTMVIRALDESQPPVSGEACNVYRVFTYTGDRETLKSKVSNEGPDSEHRIIGW